MNCSSYELSIDYQWQEKNKITKLLLILQCMLILIKLKLSGLQNNSKVHSDVGITVLDNLVT